MVMAGAGTLDIICLSRVYAIMAIRFFEDIIFYREQSEKHPYNNADEYAVS